MANIPPDSPAGPEQGPAPGSEAAKTDRDRIVDAFLALLAVQAFEDIGLPQIATRATVSLGTLRRHFGSKLAILAAFTRDVDHRVLDGHDADMVEEPARERLFDVLMRRIEILAPHKEAVRSLLRSARHDPCLALALNTLAVQSQQWMLSAADINAAGPRGLLRAQGLAMLYARVLDTFVHDEAADHARTMAALDNALGRGERWVGFLDGACRVACSPLRLLRGRRRRWRPRDRGRDEDMGDTVAA